MSYGSWRGRGGGARFAVASVQGSNPRDISPLARQPNPPVYISAWVEGEGQGGAQLRGLVGTTRGQN